MSRESSVDKVWKTAAGFKAAIIKTRQEFYCGYVGVTEESPLFELDYSSESPYIKDITEEEELGQRSPIMLLGGFKPTAPVAAFDVHGGLTFSGFIGSETHFPDLNDGLWYFGYDCSHYRDGKFPVVDEEGNIIYDCWDSGYPPKSLEFCIQQCESLAAQLVEKTLPFKAVEPKE